MDLVARVISRHLRQADVIGDPHELLQKFDMVITHLADVEPDISKMREADAIIQRVPDAEHKAFWQETHGSYKDELTPHETELVRFWGKNIHKFMGRASDLGIFHKTGAPSLFLAILQQYALPPKVRKNIENASRFFSKSRLQTPKKPQAVEAYEKYLKNLRAMSMAAHEALAHGKPLAGGAGGEAPPEKQPAGPFTLINTGGFDEKTMLTCAKVVEHAASLLKSHSMGKVCYGDVLISNTISRRNVLAFYLIEKDEMFVRANLKGHEHDAVDTVLHELGHRLYFKFLKDKHAEIRHLYSVIANKDSQAKSDAIERVWKDPTLKPKIGDKYEEKGKEYEVTGFDVGPRGQMTVLLRLYDPSLPPNIVPKARISLEGYMANKGLLPKEKHTGFVTPYAKTNDQENFAEMVAYYCTGKLPQDQMEMLEGVIL